MRVNDRLVQSLLRLRDPSFTPLLDYFREKRAEELEHILRLSDQQQIFRQQGRVQELTDLMTLIGDAEKLRDKLLTSTPR